MTTKLKIRGEVGNMSSRFFAASLLALVSLVSWAAAAGAAEPLSGTFEGIDDAAGASIEIRPAGEGFQGTFFDAHGNSQAFEAAKNGEAAETVLDMDQRKVVMRMEPVPYGAKVTLVPVNEAGKLDVAAGRILHFVRQGLELPEPGEDFFPAPQSPRGAVTTNSFLASYEFWDPVGVRNGYLSLPDHGRTLVRLFPAVQLDVIWKLCLAPQADRALATALRGQGVTCPEVLDVLANAQRTGAFDEYKAAVRAQKETLRTSVRCADGYPTPQQACDNAARRLSEQAVALDTAATVLDRYR